MDPRTKAELDHYNRTHKRCPLFLKCANAEDEGWCFSHNPTKKSETPRCFETTDLSKIVFKDITPSPIVWKNIK